MSESDSNNESLDLNNNNKASEGIAQIAIENNESSGSNNNNNDDGDVLQQNKKRKQMVKRSWCWKYFKLDKTTSTVTCNLCKWTKDYLSATTPMTQHLHSHHDIHKHNNENEGNNDNSARGKKRNLNLDDNLSSSEFSDTDASDSDETCSTLSKTKKTKLDENLVNFLVKTNQPISLADNPHFRRFVLGLNKGYKSPTSKTISYNLLPKAVSS